MFLELIQTKSKPILLNQGVHCAYTIFKLSNPKQSYNFKIVSLFESIYVT